MGTALGAKVFSSSMAVSTSTENDASWASPLQFLSGPNRNQAHEIASSQHLRVSEIPGNRSAPSGPPHSHKSPYPR